MTGPSDTISRARRAMESTERLAERRFADTRWDWLRSRPRRRAVVVLWAISVVGGALLTALDDPLIALAALIVSGALVWLLRVLVRTVVDLPDEVLDERQESVRDRTFRIAYAAIVSLTMTVMLAMYIAWNSERIAYDAQPAHLNAVFFAILFGGMGLPSAIYAWTQREV